LHCALSLTLVVSLQILPPLPEEARHVRASLLSGASNDRESLLRFAAVLSLSLVACEIKVAHRVPLVVGEPRLGAGVVEATQSHPSTRLPR
jgi:hypothetical protein